MTALLPVSAAEPSSPLFTPVSAPSPLVFFLLHQALCAIYQPFHSFSEEEVLQLPRPGNGFPAVRYYANQIQLPSCAKRSAMIALFSSCPPQCLYTSISPTSIYLPYNFPHLYIILPSFHLSLYHPAFFPSLFMPEEYVHSRSNTIAVRLGGGPYPLLPHP